MLFTSHAFAAQPFVKSSHCVLANLSIMTKLEPTKGGYYLWQYVPSIAAAVIFLLLFLGMTALISWRMYKTKTWFCLPFAIGGFCKLVSTDFNLITWD